MFWRDIASAWNSLYESCNLSVSITISYCFNNCHFAFILAAAKWQPRTSSTLPSLRPNSRLLLRVERLPRTKEAFDMNPSKLVSIIDKTFDRGNTALNDWSGQLLTVEGDLFVGSIDRTQARVRNTQIANITSSSLLLTNI